MAVAWTFGILAVGFVGVQFVRPELTNPPVTADLDAPSEVKTILKTSCYNCHSNETKLPWFDRIVPAYWVAARDVKLGRARLNFSEIGKLPAGQQKAALFESVSQIELGAMPLPAYRRVHPESEIPFQHRQRLPAPYRLELFRVPLKNHSRLDIPGQAHEPKHGLIIEKRCFIDVNISSP